MCYRAMSVADDIVTVRTSAYVFFFFFVPLPTSFVQSFDLSWFVTEIYIREVFSAKRRSFTAFRWSEP